MRYLQDIPFSSSPTSNKYREGWERTFGSSKKDSSMTKDKKKNTKPQEIKIPTCPECKKNMIQCTCKNNELKK